MAIHSKRSNRSDPFFQPGASFAAMALCHYRNALSENGTSSGSAETLRSKGHAKQEKTAYSIKFRRLANSSDMQQEKSRRHLAGGVVGELRYFGNLATADGA